MNGPLVETIRLGPKTRARLSTLKRRTGIDHWNILCRWAFCLSVSDPSDLGERYSDSGTGVEMTWRTFAGEHEALYELLLANQCQLSVTPSNQYGEAELVRRHIARGVLRLLGNKEIAGLNELVALGLPVSEPQL